MINNDVRNRHGQVTGFRCTDCGKTYQIGWGTVCNSCRKSDDDNRKLRSEIRALRKAIQNK